jgi:predicted amidohydrolase YtcJ
VFTLALCALTGAAIAAEQTDGSALVGEADVVYQNGFVYTVDGVRSRAEAFAIRDGKYLKIGSNDDMKPLTGPDTRVVDLEGRMVMPGLVDTHIHALRGALTALGRLPRDLVG